MVFFSVLSPPILSPSIQPYECVIYIQSLSPSWKAFSEIKLLFFWASPVNRFLSHPLSSATEPPWSTNISGSQRKLTPNHPNKSPLTLPKEQDLFSSTTGCNIYNNDIILNILIGETLFWLLRDISMRLHADKIEVTGCRQHNHLHHQVWEHFLDS